MDKNVTRVSHEVYGLGTYVRTTKRPERLWIRWDDTGLTTAVAPHRVKIVDN